MNQDACKGSPRTEELQSWMAAYIAKEMNIKPDEIDYTAPFENFAIDSMAVVAMTGELETWLNREIDPMLIYDYPSIKELSDYLTSDSEDS